MQCLLESFVIQFTTVSSGGVAIQEVHAFPFNGTLGYQILPFYLKTFLDTLLYSRVGCIIFGLHTIQCRTSQVSWETRKGSLCAVPPN